MVYKYKLLVFNLYSQGLEAFLWLLNYDSQSADSSVCVPLSDVLVFNLKS